MFIQRSLRSYQRHFTEVHRETVTQKICPVCSKSFLRPGDLKLHLAKAHLLSGAALADSLVHSTSELLPNPSFICPGNFLSPRPRLPLSITCHPSPDMSSLSPDMSDSTLPDTLYMAIDTCPSAISTLGDSGEPVGILPVVGSRSLSTVLIPLLLVSLTYQLLVVRSRLSRSLQPFPLPLLHLRHPPLRPVCPR